MTERTLLNPGDPLPAFTAALPGGRALRLPDALAGPVQRRPVLPGIMRALCPEHAGPLLRYALHLMSGDRQRAEDIAQETLPRAPLHPEAIADRPARPWLVAVARNLAVDSFRARKARPHEVGAGALELPSVPDDADRAPESRAVAEALRSLLPEHRGVLLETYYHGRSVAEAAAVLGITPGTVKFRAFPALGALKLALQERGLAP